MENLRASLSISADFGTDVRTYTAEMRKCSDRWATISQRPIYNLETCEKIYNPLWIERLEKHLQGSLQ